jgi:hypothetical protein
MKKYAAQFYEEWLLVNKLRLNTASNKQTDVSTKKNADAVIPEIL